MLLLIKLLLAHLIGDFFLQPKKWVKEKESKKLLAIPLYLHALVHGLLVMLLVWDWAFWAWGLLVLLIHLIIDSVKLHLQKDDTKREWFFIDQLAHLLSLYLIYCLYQGYFEFNTTFFNEANYLIATILVFLTKPCSYFVKIFISRWQPNEPTEPNTSLHDAGLYIGILERLFVFTFVVTNNWEAIGFLLAAKSVFRFGDLTNAKDRKLTEYILIGTFLSFGIAILGGMIYRIFVP
ncbi:MAG: DUF3307 domain-containing protein [Cyclobacteriaceae bacterium]|nr:DUF3307 domain-containing protein [Cyclobacteriaceae bacterium]